MTLLLPCLLLQLALTAMLAPPASGQCLSSHDDLSDEGVPKDLQAITDFNLNLFREVFPYNTSQNFFFCPYGIWNSLTLAMFGAEGHTLLQLQKVLGHKDKVTAVKQMRHLQLLYDMRQKALKAYTFNLANKAYFDDVVNLRQCMRDIFPNEIENLDFDQPEAAAKQINGFVSHVTKNRIEAIVSPSDIADSRMAIVNAAFFKGTWLYQFKAASTKKELFYASPDQYHFVDMMNQKGNFRSGPSEELGAHLLELPYSGGEISMIILLPPFLKGAAGFDEMVAKLTGPVLHDAINSLWRGPVQISIPKFKLEQRVGDELISALMSMGVTDLFDPSVANLTAFDPAGGLAVTKAVHKAFLEVNEEGTEAAAATALIQFRVARPLEPQKFVCNHPFLFCIYDNETKNILFLGAYKNPVA